MWKEEEILSIVVLNSLSINRKNQQKKLRTKRLFFFNKKHQQDREKMRFRIVIAIKD